MRWPLVIVLSLLLLGQAPAQDGKVEFFKAVHEGDLSSVRQMAEHDPSLVNSDLGRGIRPLYRAAAMNRPEMVALLLELGGQLEATTPQGNTALFAAAAGGHITV
ncbi:MAG: ankyrin repeat domain-containing protein, partial [Candidatus Eremiobacteraeota bacterium]|nr:ankyrin repeat domain-containing protein [Candidatus Eremiobacteraeota bacterium]